MKSAERNSLKTSQKASKGKRFSDVVTKFATSLFIYSGPLAYNFIQQNMPTALPHLRTVQRRVQKENSTIKDGEFRFKELSEHLKRYDCPKIVTVGEDATRLISKIDYDSSTDQLVGFVLPIDDAGLPKVDAYTASSFEIIEDHFSKGVVGKYAYLYVVKPLSESAPSFILSCMSSDNRFTNKHVLQRWKHIHTERAKLGIQILSFGADGDSREMKGMRVSTQVQFKADVFFSNYHHRLPFQNLRYPMIGWHGFL